MDLTLWHTFSFFATLCTFLLPSNVRYFFPLSPTGFLLIAYFFSYGHVALTVPSISCAFCFSSIFFEFCACFISFLLRMTLFSIILGGRILICRELVPKQERGMTIDAASFTRSSSFFSVCFLRFLLASAFFCSTVFPSLGPLYSFILYYVY